MERFQSTVAAILITLAGVSCFSPAPVRAESSAQARNQESSSMETIREAVRRPEVKEALNERGISEDDIEHRLALLKSNLSHDQKRYLARQLAPTDSTTSPRKIPASGGNQFLSTTLDLVTSIILLPIKIVAWFIPGL